MHNKTLFFWLIFIFGSLFLFLCTVTATALLFNKELLLSSDKGNIGVVEVKGVILEVEDELRALRDFAEDSEIKGIVLRVDSPGGAVGPSQELFSEVLKVRESKPVVASIGSVGASGGYYVACAAQRVVANAGSLTGSIGVLMEFVNLSELLSWAKVKPETMKSGSLKDIGNSNRPMTRAERELIQSLLTDVHEQFKQDILSSRKTLKPKDLDRIADGRILTGRQAKEAGLVDRLGNLYRAAELVAELAGMKEKPTLAYPKRKTTDLVDLLSSMSKIVSHLESRLQGRASLLSLMRPLLWQ